MNTRAFLLSSLIAGVVMGFLGGLPIISLANCILCLWVWASAMLGVFLYFRFDKEKPKLSSGQGLLLGLVAGLIGAIVVWLLSLITHGRASQAVADVLASTGVELPMGAGALATGLSILGFFMDLILYAIFGAIGGLIGAAIFKGKGSTPVEVISPSAPRIVEPAPVMPEPIQPAAPETPEPMETEPPAEQPPA